MCYDYSRAMSILVIVYSVESVCVAAAYRIIPQEMKSKWEGRNNLQCVDIALFPSFSHCSVALQYVLFLGDQNWMVGRPGNEASLGGQLLDTPFFFSPIDQNLGSHHWVHPLLWPNSGQGVEGILHLQKHQTQEEGELPEGTLEKVSETITD